ncbi:uncharacterized protein LOC144863056 [Branchiostoma floridae x Branchiostoma japonicum]
MMGAMKITVMKRLVQTEPPSTKHKCVMGQTTAGMVQTNGTAASGRASCHVAMVHAYIGKRLVVLATFHVLGMSNTRDVTIEKIATMAVTNPVPLLPVTTEPCSTRPPDVTVETTVGTTVMSRTVYVTIYGTEEQATGALQTGTTPVSSGHLSTPHTHNHTPQAYPRAGLERNYCRNPDGKDRPWCYTDNPLIRWMYCDDVFACDALPTRCFYSIDNERSYAGRINRAGYRVCQRWDSQSPHSHPHTPRAHPDAGLEENFCRNPDNKERPWCYTTDESRRWDYCDVMECADPFLLRCNEEYTCFEQQQHRLCYCDNDCTFFGDCCEDFIESSSAQTPSDHHRLKWKCVPGFSKGGDSNTAEKESYWMVANCPDEWTDDVTRDQCLKQADPFNPSDLVYRMPVEDNSGRVQAGSNAVPYRNIFCAICNNVSLAHVSVWESQVECSGLLNLSLHDHKDSQVYNRIIDSGKDCFGTNRLVFIPSDTSHVRRCLWIPTEISNENCDFAACRSYSYPVDSGYKIYKNVHCALCEGLSMAATTNLFCKYTFVVSRLYCLSNCPLTLSLSNLFNFNVYGVGTDSPNQCPSGTLYDPFPDTCRIYLSIHGSNDGSPNKTVPLQNCSEPALTFTAEEFHFLPNGSVHLLSSNASCPAEQVAILNTTASICGECILQYFTNYTKVANSWGAGQVWLTVGLVIASAVVVFAFVVYTVRSGGLSAIKARLGLGGPEQNNGATTSASHLPTAAGGTDATAGGTGSAKEIRMATLDAVDVEGNIGVSGQ